MVQVDALVGALKRRWARCRSTYGAAARGLRAHGVVADYGKKRETAETVADVEVSDGGAVDARATTYKLVPTTYKWRIKTD